MSRNKMVDKYRCFECADKKRSKKCFDTGVCPYANDFEPEEEKPLRAHKKRVRCVETGVVYESVSAAERAFGAGKGRLSSAVDHPGRSLKGYHFVSA